MGNYSALEIAEYIIGYSKQRNYSISNLKLQKILYFLQAQFLVSFNTPCFVETIEAWDLGPVVRNVYNKYRRYGSANIYLGSLNLENIMSDRESQNIRLIIDRCSNYSANKLVDITHNQAPWKKAYYRGNKIIYNEDIQDYFRR